MYKQPLFDLGSIYSPQMYSVARKLKLPVPQAAHKVNKALIKLKNI
jgi:hypothetical protein